MSHFSILCVGDVDYNMAPFHEFETDGIDDEFIEAIDITEKCKNKFKALKELYQKQLSDYNAEIKNITDADELRARQVKFEKDTKYSFKGQTFEEYLRDYAEKPIIENEDAPLHPYGYAIRQSGDDFKVYNRTNPNSFYDYYSMGYEAFILKNGRKTSHAIKKDIDFNKIYSVRETELRKKYNDVINKLGFVPQIETTWDSLIPKFSPSDGSTPVMTREEAENIYTAQPDVIKFNEANLPRELIGFWANAEDYACTEDEFVKRNCAHCLSYGFVENRTYHSKGRMGWWACSTDEKAPEVWDKEYEDFINSLPDDAELTMLNCHV